MGVKKCVSISLRNTRHNPSLFSFFLSSCVLKNNNFPYFPLPFVCQSVVNLISELQEQMCRFQQEINCRIREKTGQADSSLQKACDTGSTDAQNPDHGLACDGSPEEVHDSGLEESPDVIPFSGMDNSSSTEEQCCCGRGSVGRECLHDL